MSAFLAEGGAGRTAARALVAKLAANRTTRSAMNTLYNSLSPRAKRRFYLLFAKIFRTRNIAVDPGNWNVSFLGKTIAIPLSQETMWLGWDTALSVVGSDVTVKETYANIISRSPPDIFCDIGANYGTHSLMFLCHGVPALTFEPNPACMERFKVACEANRVSPQIELVALADKHGTARLAFPERDTWLGTLLPTDSTTHEKSIEVPVFPLDHYLPLLRGKRALIKIDAEGSEKLILDGASEVLKTCRPMVIFECWADADFRLPLFNSFDRLGYDISPLPWTQGSRARLSETNFIRSTDTNFIAVPTATAPV